MSDLYPSADAVRCGPSGDPAVTEAQEEVGGDREEVRHVDRGLVPEVGDPLAEFPAEVRMQDYDPNPRAGSSLG